MVIVELKILAIMECHLFLSMYKYMEALADL